MKRAKSLSQVGEELRLARIQVKPERRTFTEREIVTVIGGSLMTEDGQLLDDPFPYLYKSNPLIVICDDPGWLLMELEKRYNNTELFPDYNWRLVPGSGQVRNARLDRFRFSKRQSMHMVLGLTTMGLPNPPMDIVNHHSAMKFGIDIKNFCRDQNKELATNFPALAAKFLRDRRFYPEPRRKVPTATNEKVRQFLPGVHREMYVPYNKRFNIITLDLKRAYHLIAQELELPNANTLLARGYFGDPENVPTYWVSSESPEYRQILDTHSGLLYIGATYDVPDKQRSKFAPPYLDFFGFKRIAVWTNELKYIQSLGVKIHGIYAAWTSDQKDYGLPRFGKWAMEEINRSDEFRASWLKPVLLMPYGLLGSKPRIMTNAFKYSKGETKAFIVGRISVDATYYESVREMQIPIANVIQLGMIQAEQRVRMFQMAGQLEEQRFTVTCIYADSIHITGKAQLPLDFINDPRWTVSERTNVVYLDSQSWKSDQGHCLPGRPSRKLQERLHRESLVTARYR